MKVPTDSMPSVGPEGLPNVQDNINVRYMRIGASELGQGLQQLGGDIQGIAGQVQQRVNATQVANGITAYQGAWTKAGYGTAMENSTAAQGDPTVSGLSRPLAAAAKVNPSNVASGSATATAPVGVHPGVAVNPAMPGQAQPVSAPTAPDAPKGISPNGFLNERGLNALRYETPTLQYMQQQRLAIAKTMNPAAAQVFLARSSPLLEDFHRQIAEHSFRESQFAHAASLQSRVASGFTTASNLVNSSENVNDALKAVGDEVNSVDQSIDELAGSQEEAAAQKAAFHQKVYEQMASQYLSGRVDPVTHHVVRDPTSAQAVLAAHGDDIGYGAAGVAARDQLQKAILKQQSQNDAFTTVNGMVQNAKLADSGFYDRAKFDQQFLALPPDQKQKYLDTYERMGRVLDDENTANGQGMFHQAYSQWAKRQNLADVDPNLAQKMQTYYGEGWNRLVGIARDTRAAKAREARGGNKETPEQLENFGQMLVDRADHPDDWSHMSVEAFTTGFRGRLSDSGYKRGLELLAASHAAANKPTGSPGLPSDADDLLVRRFREAGIIGNSGNPMRSGGDDGRIVGEAHNQLEKFRAQFKASHGQNEPKPEDYDKAIGDMLRPVKVQQPWYKSDSSVTQIESQALPKYQGKPVVPAAGAQPPAALDEFAHDHPIAAHVLEPFGIIMDGDQAGGSGAGQGPAAAPGGATEASPGSAASGSPAQGSAAEQPVPAAAAQRIRAQWHAKFNTDPTADQVQSVYATFSAAARKSAATGVHRGAATSTSPSSQGAAGSPAPTSDPMRFDPPSAKRVFGGAGVTTSNVQVGPVTFTPVGLPPPKPVLVPPKPKPKRSSSADELSLNESSANEVRDALRKEGIDHPTVEQIRDKYRELHAARQPGGTAR